MDKVRIQITSEREIHLGDGRKAKAPDRVNIERGLAKVLVDAGCAKWTRKRRDPEGGDRPVWQLSTTGIMGADEDVESVSDV